MACIALPLALSLGCGSTFTAADAPEAGGSSGSDTDGGEASSGGASTGGSSSDDGGGMSTGGAVATDSPGVTGGTSSSGGQGGDGGTPGTGGGDGNSGGGDGSGGEASGESYDCNPEHIICLPIIAPEPCPAGEVYAVESSCYGECVPIGACACGSAADCPDPNDIDEYTCHGTTDRCGPWLR